METSSIETKGSLEIVDYSPGHQSAFEALNREWIERFFEMEAPDYEMLQNPEENILKKGGSIFMALWNDLVVGTVALKPVSPGIFELTKMAVNEAYQGRKIGRALAEAAVRRAQNSGAEKIILYSNTMLGPALALYKKLGFREIPVDGPYKRSDIKMQLTF
jgi:ribosomal protein S18 acetylase RimI-like enzyme